MKANKTQVKRGRNRAVDSKDTANAIIDDNLMCTIAQIRDGYPVATPTCHWRDGDRFYWHGHATAQNVVGSTAQLVSINICRLDGLVMARSAFHHSVNYQSVTLFGEVNTVVDEAEKSRQLAIFLKKISANRWPQLRPVTQKELMVTSVAWITIDEYSIKVRAEGVNDDEGDLHWPVWAGVLPIKQTFNQPICLNEASQQGTYSAPSMPAVFKRPIFGE